VRAAVTGGRRSALDPPIDHKELQHDPPCPIKAVTLAAVLVAALIGFALLASAHTQASPRPDGHGWSPGRGALAHAPANAPTIVLVHGAFADSSSWDAEVDRLTRSGYPVISFATPLRGVSYDSEELDDLLQTINGPIVLVGHSYAGMVVSQVAAEDPAVKALVYVAAFIPQVGESVNSLNSMFPGSELVPANLHTTNAPGGLTDVYIDQDTYGQVYAGGLSPAQIRVAAATQRPITAQALADPATVAAPASTPKWEIVATQDNAVPTKLEEFMGKRAGAALVYAQSGHDVPAAQPGVVDSVIVKAAAVAAH
jgi:pimeloyl-ACP methyl ester carboxylesterase